MPVRSLNSSVHKWPDRPAVERALKKWIRARAVQHPELQAAGYFGSYARGDWGVGSDLDIVAVVEYADLPFETRARQWPLETLPVPAELLVYTAQEWRDLLHRGGRFADTLRRETVWIYP